MNDLSELKTNVLHRDLTRRLQTIQTGIKTTLGAAWDAGNIMLELKKRGELTNYSYYGLSDRQAQKYMQLAKNYTRDQAIENRTINQALENLSAREKLAEEQNNRDAIKGYQADIEDEDQAGKTPQRAGLKGERLVILDDEEWQHWMNVRAAVSQWVKMGGTKERRQNNIYKDSLEFLEGIIKKA